MQSATVDDFLQTILSIRGEQLNRFLYKNLDIYANRAGYEGRFDSGPENFLEACKRICVERAGTRWVDLIEDIFNYAKLGDDLNAAQPAAVE